ncbi:MAG: YeeE/YedE family protein [Pyrinomonadaceae bacterium]|nr:YeeE/YedE family protein [Pyrinomonadaceae bacterium]
MFDPISKLLLGLATGMVFGFLLQKGRAAKFHVIIGQFLLKDWTVVKIMATAVAVGTVGVYALVSMGVATLHIKPALLGGVLLGGVLFGAGLAVFGYCPGTSVAASGEGRRDAMVGVVGMLFGAGVYVALYPALQPIIKGLADWGKITLPQATSLSPWAWVAGVVVAITTGLLALARLSTGRQSV